MMYNKCFFGEKMNNNNIKIEFSKYVTFNIIGMLGLSCYILADTYFIARGIGASGLASLNIALPMYSFMHGIGLMIGIGGATRFSLMQSKSIFTHSLYYSFFATLFFLIIGVFFHTQISYFLGADNDTIANTSIYIKTILCFAPVFILNNVIICFVRNDSSPKLSMIAMLTGSFSNIILDYVFIFIFKMGMFGAAFATGFAPIISLIILSTHFIKRNNTFHFKKAPIKIKNIFHITSLGISALITEFSFGIVLIMFNIIILNLAGNIAVAAY